MFAINHDGRGGPGGRGRGFGGRGMMKASQVNKKTGRDVMYEMEWRIEFGSGHQPGAAAVNPFNLAFAHRALLAAIKEEDPGAMFISHSARFKLPEEIPVEDAAYEAAFSPEKITPRRNTGRNQQSEERWVVCHKIVSKFQYSRELKEVLWEYLRERNVWMRFSKLGVGSTTAVGWLKNFHPVLQNRDHLTDRLSRLVLEFGNLTEEEKEALPKNAEGNHLPVVELVPSAVGETMSGKEYKCSAVQVRAATAMKDRILENLTNLANSEEGYLPESATFIPFTWSATDKELHVCAIKEHAKILDNTACISVGGMSQEMLDAGIVQEDGSTKYIHTLFTEKGLKYEMTTASASKGIYRFITKKDKIIEAAKAVDGILEIISNDETIPEGITTDFSRPTRFKTTMTDKPEPSAAMLSYTQKMRAALMSHGAHSDSDESAEEEGVNENQGWQQVTRRQSKATPGSRASSKLSYASVVQTAGSTMHTVSPLSSIADKSSQSAIKQIREEFKQQSTQSENTMRLFREEMRRESAATRELVAASRDNDNNATGPSTSPPDIAAMIEKLTTVVLQLQTDFKEQNDKVQKMWRILHLPPPCTVKDSPGSCTCLHRAR